MELTQIREKLDKIDAEIVLLLAKRVSLIPSVAEYKKKNNLPRVNKEREAQIIESKKKLAQENNLNPDLVEKIYQEIFSESHRIEKEIMGN